MLYILIGIALLGMLYFSYSKNSNTSGGIGSKGQAKAIAIQMVDQTNSVTQRTDRLLAKGCAASQLYYTDYNPNAPADFSCHVYRNSNNGGIRAPVPPVGFSDNSVPTKWWGNGYVNQAHIMIPGMGSDSCDEFFIAVWKVRQDVCLEIDKIIGLKSIPVAGGAWGGGLSVPHQSCDIWGGWNVAGMPEFQQGHLCFFYIDQYVYARVLFPR